MAQIIYYVAISIDGFIAGPDDDISGFVHQQELVDKYTDDLKEFDTVIMGRKTYELGYTFGLKPGQRAYPHMRHYIFSRTLSFESADENLSVCNLDLERIKKLKKEQGTDIYLCGGGQFAGWLLNNGLVDVLKIKLNPVLLGTGIPLFSGVKEQNQLKLTDSEAFPGGFYITTCDIVYQ